MAQNLDQLQRSDSWTNAPVTARYSAVIVEDDPNTVARLQLLVGRMREISVLGAYTTFADGAAAIQQHRPELLIVDLGLPDGDGIDLVRMAQSADNGTLAMVVTVFGDESHVIDAVKAGANGYLLKDAESQSIVTGVREMLAGGAPVSPAIARYLLQRFRDPRHTVDADSASGVLTKTEKTILQLVSKGYTAREIGRLNHVSYHTVTTHVKNIYRKLSISSRAEAVAEAMKLGLVTTSNAI